MSRAAFTVTKWRKYRNAGLYGTTMEALVDADLQHPNPPSSDSIVELILLGDRHMIAMLSSGAIPSSQRGMSVAAISHDSTHPFYKLIANAFGYVNSRRKKACLSLDKWPIPITVRPPLPIPTLANVPEKLDRRLIWSLNRREVCAARGVFKRYAREGLVPFLVGSNGEALERITVFDPASCEVLFKPIGAITDV